MDKHPSSVKHWLVIAALCVQTSDSSPECTAPSPAMLTASEQDFSEVRLLHSLKTRLKDRSVFKTPQGLTLLGIQDCLCHCGPAHSTGVTGGKTILERPELPWREWISVPRGLQAESGWPLGRIGMWQFILIAFKVFSSLDILGFLYRTRHNPPLQHHA